jgi:glutamyl-tRNA reductase
MTSMPTQGRVDGPAVDPQEQSEWLTVHEACALTGVSAATLRRWSDAGDVSAYTTPGGHRRFRRTAILALVGPRSTRRVDKGRRAETTAPDASSPVMPAGSVGTLLAVVAHARRVTTAAREEYAQRLAAVAADPAVLVIHTCQRVEVYVAADCADGLHLPEAPAGAVHLADVDAARHLISVACGLDSAVLGEDQVLHQIRETLALRQAAGPLAPVVDRLFQVALHAGRRARGSLGPVRRSLADVALDTISERCGDLTGRTVLVVGAGRMGALAATTAYRRGAHVLVTNRSLERALLVAHDVHGETCDWALSDITDDSDVVGVVVAQSGPWPLSDEARDRLCARGTVVVDLSSPISTSDAAQLALGDLFHSIDDLAWSGPHQLPPGLEDELEALVSESGREFCRWLRSRAAQPTIQSLTDAIEVRRRSELEWLLHRLPELDEHDRALVEQMSQRLVAGILHAPRKALSADDSGSLHRAATALFAL